MPTRLELYSITSFLRDTNRKALPEQGDTYRTEHYTQIMGSRRACTQATKDSARYNF